MISYYDKEDINESIESGDDFAYDMKEKYEEAIYRLRYFAEDSIYEDTGDSAPEDNINYVYDKKLELTEALNQLKKWCDEQIEEIKKIEVIV